MPPRKILSCLLATIALIAIASPARASDWNYACKGALNDSRYCNEELDAVLTKAPHPNAAKVFTDFLFDKEGQQILADDGLYVPNEAVTYPKDRRPLKDLKLIKVDPEEIQKRDDEVKKKFRELFGV